MSQVIFFANNNVGPGQSGGDTIFLNFLKFWHTRQDITVFASSETAQLIHQNHIDGITIIPTDTINKSPNHLSTLSLISNTTRRTIKSFLALWHHRQLISQSQYVYSVSDFYPDSLPALISKLLNPRLLWLSGYYLVAPSPLSPQTPYIGPQRLKGLLYYLMQRLSYFSTYHFADFVLITSQPDIKYFLAPHRNFNHIIVVRGGVDFLPTKKNLISKIYDACFIGRLHPQKGVMLLPDIWKEVVKHNPNAKLAIIGDGQLKSELIQKIKGLGLSSNIKLLGFLNGPPKYRIFQQSRLVLHPATYDSGGMASAEAMAFGLPGVAFDLESLKTYYPQGMIKTPCFDTNLFAQNIIHLLTNTKLYDQLSRQATQLVRRNFDWSKQAENLYNQIFYDSH